MNDHNLRHSDMAN